MQQLKNISIRTKTIIAIALFCGGVIAGIYYFSFSKISVAFDKLENRIAKENILTTQEAIATVAQSAINTLDNWAQWDDAYQFLGDRNANFIKSNLQINLTTLNIDMIGFWLNNKQLAWGRNINLQTAADSKKLSPISRNDIQSIKKINVLFHSSNNLEKKYVFAKLEHGNYLLISLPIIPTSAKAPARGELIAGIKVDENFFSKIGTHTHLNLIPIDPNSTATTSDELKILSEVDSGNTIIKPMDDEYLNGYDVIKDYNDEKLVYYKIKIIRDINRIYHYTMKTFLIAMIFGGIAMVIAVLISVNKLLITRLLTLSNHIKRIKRTGDLGQRVPNLGGDEIGQLGLSFNETFEEINNLKEASFHSEKMASLGEMAGGIAHEINNPITIIGASANIMKKMINNDINDKEKYLKQINDIEKTVVRISKIISGLRNVSRDATAEAFSECRLIDILEDTLSISGEKFKAHGIDIRVNLDDPIFLTSISCLRVQLSQVFFNLFGNAYDAIVGTEDAWISIQASILEDMLVVRCLDSGKGIPLEIQSKIFQPFYTTKEIGKGTGLGLSLSNSIVQRHGGVFTLDNDLPNTCFVIKLPIKNAVRIAS